MKKTVLYLANKYKTGILLGLLVILTCSFGPGMTEQEWLDWSNKCLNESYNPPPEIKLKKWDLMITPTHFIRFSKVYQHGKVEYFAFDLKRFAEVNYMDGNSADTLQFKTTGKDIIFQTYHDPNGNVDSMTNSINIPVKAMSPERIDSLSDALNYFKEKNL
jgi:hypothetical protein